MWNRCLALEGRGWREMVIKKSGAKTNYKKRNFNYWYQLVQLVASSTSRRKDLVTALCSIRS
jgi:hypothetical protein